MTSSPHRIPATTLITGASAGIGLALAARFASAGHPLVLVARGTERLEAARSEILKQHRVPITIVPLDLAHPESPSRLLEICAALGLDVGVLVNNAGIAVRNDRQLTAPEEVRRMLQLNMVTLTELCCRFGRRFQEGGRGFILNISSMTAYVGASSLLGYGASKRYVLAYTRELARAFAGSGVRVSCLVPGLTETTFFERSGLHLDGVAARRLGLASPDEVAELGYRQTFAGPVVRVCGAKNRILAAIAPLLPASLIDRKRKQLHGGPPPALRTPD